MVRYARWRPVTTAREKIEIGLGLDAIGQPVDLNIVDWHVRQQNPSASPSEVQNETLEVIRALVSEGWFRLGHTEKGRFVASKHSLDHSMKKISHDYVKYYDEPKRWMFAVSLEFTDKGEQFARARAEKDIASYRRKT
jgi:hypothetical protein